MRASLAARVAATLATAGMVLTAAPGEATTGCLPTAGSARAAMRVAGLLEQAPGSWGARLSATGRFVAFASFEDDLVANDADGLADVFRADRTTGQILQVSVDTDGLAAQGHAAEASISADGTRVAFSSPFQVHVRDLRAERTTLVSVNGSGTAGNEWSGSPVISPRGRFVAFTSRASNLVASDRDVESLEAYLRDLDTGTTERVSVGAAGLSTPTWSWAEAVSEDGRYVAFTAGWAGGSLSADDTYPGSDVFVRDRQTQKTELISVAPDGRSMGGWFLGMSADGMRVLFGAGPQPDSKPAVFLRDRVVGTTSLVAPLLTTWRRHAGNAPAPAPLPDAREMVLPGSRPSPAMDRSSPSPAKPTTPPGPTTTESPTSTSEK